MKEGKLVCKRRKCYGNAAIFILHNSSFILRMKSSMPRAIERLRLLMYRWFLSFLASSKLERKPPSTKTAGIFVSRITQKSPTFAPLEATFEVGAVRFKIAKASFLDWMARLFFLSLQ